MFNVNIIDLVLVAASACSLLASVVICSHPVVKNYRARRSVNKEILNDIRERYPNFEDDYDFKKEVVFQLEHFGYVDDSPTGFNREGYRRLISETIEKICNEYS